MTMRNDRARRIRLGVAVSGLAFGAMLPNHAMAEKRTASFSIPAGSLDGALKLYMRATGRQILYPSALVEGQMAPALSGPLDPDAALNRLLAGKAIRIQHKSRNIYVLVAGDASTDRTETAVRPKRTAERPASGPRPTPADPVQVNSPDIIVTGSNIRGAKDGPSPVTTITALAIDRAGAGTVAEALADLPQNFGGTANETTTLLGTDTNIRNITAGSSVNLRGLGSDATLTLINGRRVAGSGGKGDFTDLSTVPLAAVERIEILADGASALYGSDAIGGVVNILLKKDFKGAESRARYGSVTKGGSTDLQLGQVAGIAWNGGHALAAYEYEKRTSLAASERLYTRSADLRPFGGNDYRTFFSEPGNILVFDPSIGSFAPRYAIPSGQNGRNLTSADFRPGVNLSSLRGLVDLLPDQTRHSAYANVEQDLTPAIKIYVEGRYAHRQFHFNGVPSLTVMQVTPANPFFVAPPGGGAFTLVAYSFGGDIGPVQSTGTVEAWSATGGATIAPFGDWKADAYVSYARERGNSHTANLVNATYLAEALGNLPDNPATSYSAARDGYFNPFGDPPGVNAKAITDFIAGGLIDETVANTLLTANAVADGTLVELPGGRLKLALGGQWRREDFDRDTVVFFSGLTPTAAPSTRADRTITSLFGELAVPIFGPGNAIPGIRRLDLSLALRHEQYSDFGSTTNPKLGLVWEPVAGLALRGSYGTSFRAPALLEVRDLFKVGSTQLTGPGGATLATIQLTGGNTDLKPEKAKSLNVGMRLAPPDWHGFSMELAYFRTRFSDRIGQPVSDAGLQVLTNPVYAPFVQFIDPANNAADLAKVTAFANVQGTTLSALIPLTSYRAIVDARYVNSASVLVRGMDLTLTDTVDFGGGKLALSFNASFLFDYTEKLTPTSVTRERVDTVNSPPDLKLRAWADWTIGDYGVGTAINHVGRYSDDVSVPARPVDAYTTIDLQLRYEPQATEGWRKGLSLALNAQNLFDAKPPFVDRSLGFGYDPANADIVGRFVSLQLRKRW
jgi:iron complex outermembrane recepter protein